MLKISGRWEATNFPTARSNNLPDSLEVVTMVAVKEFSWEEMCAA